MNYIKFFQRQHFKKCNRKKVFMRESFGYGEDKEGIIKFIPDNPNYPDDMSTSSSYHNIVDVKNFPIDNLSSLLFPNLNFCQFKFKLNKDEFIYINVSNNSYQIIFIEKNYKYYNTSDHRLDDRLKNNFNTNLENLIGKQRMRDYNIEQLFKTDVKV